MPSKQHCNSFHIWCEFMDRIHPLQNQLAMEGCPGANILMVKLVLWLMWDIRNVTKSFSNPRNWKFHSLLFRLLSLLNFDLAYCTLYLPNPPSGLSILISSLSIQFLWLLPAISQVQPLKSFQEAPFLLKPKRHHLRSLLEKNPQS